MRGQCEHRRGNINAGAANAEVFAGDEHSRERLFDPMAAISRRWRGGRIYNNTRTRVLLRRKCVKPADLTAHSRRRSAPAPHSDAHCPSIFSPPSRTLQLPPPRADAHPQAAPCIPRRRPSLAPSVPLRTQKKRHRTVDVRCIPRRPHDPFPAEDLRPPPHSDTPSPSTSAPPRSPDAHPQAARCTPADLTTHSPSKTFARRPHNTFLVEDLLPSPSVPLRAQKNGTAQWMCDAECLGRPSLRSVIWVGEPRAVRRRCGALAWRVGLRPQPWALRSRRCGRVLRA